MKKRIKLYGIAVTLVIFALAALVLALGACGGGGRGYTSIDAVAKYLSNAKGGASADDPVQLKVNMDLQNMTVTESNWQRLLGAINTAGKYVALDLSGCTMPNTVFDPDGRVNTGKSLIVSLVLPTVAESIPDGWMYDVRMYNEETIAFGYFTSLREITGSKITSIGEGAFAGCDGVTSVSFPAVTQIGDYAFCSCTSLASVDFPMVARIGEEAFNDCYSLTSVSFPAAVSIGSSAFGGCANLESVDFPAATSIGGSAFKNCTGLTSVDFPMVKSIEYDAFLGCTSLTSASFPMVTDIGSTAFSSCTSLSNVTLGTIAHANFGMILVWGVEYRPWYTFPGNLRDVYFAPGGGAGTYVTSNPGRNPTWTKQ